MYIKAYNRNVTKVRKIAKSIFISPKPLRK